VKRALPIVLCALIQTGCRDHAAPPAPGAGTVRGTSASPPGPASSLDPAAPYACRADGDCEGRCDLGALSAAWLRSQRGLGTDCEDGCTSKGMRTVCETGRCVSLDRDGKLAAGCSFRVQKGEPRCRLLSSLFAALLAKAPGTCAKDQDCGLYAAGVTTSCGGVTDRATAEKLGALSADFISERCPWVVDCAPRRTLVPTCGNGRCVGR